MNIFGFGRKAEDIQAPPAAPSLDRQAMTDKIVAAMQTVFDPEIPVNIYELGLVYSIVIADDGVVDVAMTLTAPGCPVAGEMPGWVKDAVMKVEGVQDVNVELVWEPTWDISMMSEAARLELGYI